MTLIEYFWMDPFKCIFCIVGLVVFPVVFAATIDSDKYKKSSLFSTLVYISAGLWLAISILTVRRYSDIKRAIDQKYTLYIDGEQSILSSPIQAMMDDKHYIIDTDKGWVLCKSKPTQTATDEYFADFNKEVPKQ